MSSVVVEFTTGAPGTGKTYRRAGHFIVNELLDPKCPSADRIWCNYPIEFESWTDGHGIEQKGLYAIANEKYGLEEFEVDEKVRVFPKEVVESWLRFDTSSKAIVTPSDFFNDNEIKLDACHIAIDEIHNFCPSADKIAATSWSKWLGEIRHEGATIEFLSQHPSKVSKAIINHAALRRQMVHSGLRRDWWVNIQLEDWYNVGTVIGRKYRPSVWEVEEREVLGKWKVSSQVPFWFRPEAVRRL